MNRFLCLLLPIALGILRCSNPQQAGGSDETSTGIKLAGFVYNQSDNSGVANVVTRLKKTGFSTTTDEDGFFELTISNDSLKKEGVELEGLEDTLEYLLRDTVLTMKVIDNWEAILPSVFIVQRNIYGKITGDTAVVRSIQAIIKGDTVNDSVTIRTFSLWYNRATSGFSGFSWFNKAGDTATFYSVYVTVYNNDSLLIGRSQTIRFPDDIAGDIEIPAFDAQNALPIADAGEPCTVSINDTIALAGTAHDNFGGLITEWEWDVGAKGTFIETTPDSVLVITAPAGEDSSFNCILRVTDNDGNMVCDTVALTVEADIPKVAVTLSKDTVSINDTVLATAHVSDRYGRVVQWEWRNGDSSEFVITTPDSTFIIVAPATADSSYTCVVRITDDDDNVVYDTVSLCVIADIPKVAVTLSKDIVSINDTILAAAHVSDRFGRVVQWEWRSGDSSDFITTTPDSTFIIVAPATADSSYTCVVRITDDDDNAVYDTVSLCVIADIPVPRIHSTAGAAKINDTITLVGSAFDRFGSVVKWKWVLDSGVTVIGADTGSSIRFIAPSVGDSSFVCSLTVTDDDGNRATATTSLVVVDDPPLILAQTADSVVFINDTITVSGRLEKPDSLVRIEWSGGDSGLFIETTPRFAFTIKAPSVADTSFECILRVTDVDGNIVSDTVHVRVLQGIPLPMVTNTKYAVRFDHNMYCNGTASDSGGHIVKWEWDAGNTGTFIETSPDSHFVTTSPPEISDSFPVVLRVTDDDGNRAMDTGYYQISLFEGGSGSVVEPRRANCVAITSAEINNSGDMDLVVVLKDNASNTIGWYSNNAPWRFYPIDTKDYVFDLITADIDRDNDTDILITTPQYNEMTWYENDGAGNFTEHTIHTTISDPGRIAVQDLDGDDDNDIVVSSTGYSFFALLLNNGKQQFTERMLIDSIYPVRHAQNLFIDDVDGDKDPDIICAFEMSYAILGSVIFWYENDGSLSFTPHLLAELPNNLFINDCIMSDIDRDGDNDIVLSSQENAIELYQNNGAGMFSIQKVITLEKEARQLEAVDLDGDSDIDIISTADSTILWHENKGSIGFDTHEIINDRYFSIHTIHIADYGNDGDFDIFYLRQIESAIYIQINLLAF